MRLPPQALSSAPTPKPLGQPSCLPADPIPITWALSTASHTLRVSRASVSRFSGLQLPPGIPLSQISSLSVPPTPQLPVSALSSTSRFPGSLLQHPPTSDWPPFLHSCPSLFTLPTELSFPFSWVHLDLSSVRSPPAFQALHSRPRRFLPASCLQAHLSSGSPIPPGLGPSHLMVGAGHSRTDTGQAGGFRVGWG